jgi:hypothetical protein
MFSKGYLTPIVGFKCKKGAAYPMFMQKAWAELVQTGYESTSGWVNDVRVELKGSNFLFLEFSHELAGAVKAIRQVSLMYYKTKLPYSANQVKDVEDAFIAAEADLADLDLSEGSDRCSTELWLSHQGHRETVDSLLTRASHLVHRLLNGVNPLDIRPRHGSGASACRTNPWERYKRPRFIPKLDSVYPYTDWFYLSHGVDCLPQEALDNLVTVEVPVARVVYVPKDSRGPRLISAEPREFMFIQQGLMAKLYDAISAYPLVKAQLDCRDQTRNQRLARWGSASGAVATLDLKEASDRVSLTLVQRLFPRNWVKCFEACRSEATQLPNGVVVPLRKFAPMGSAVCFPVEAICFWAIAQAAQSLSKGSIENLFSTTPYGLEFNQLAVFGDDIIVPVDSASRVIDGLTSVGLVVNQDKSFLQGPFRESCGREYFLGEDVSIVRCGHVPIEFGSRYNYDQARFRTLDWFNNLIIRYGTYCLTEPLHLLFASWYNAVVVSPRVTLATNDFQDDSVPSRGKVLLGVFREIPAIGRRLLYIRGSTRFAPDVYGVRRRVREFDTRFNDDLQRFEVYTLIEMSVDQQIAIDDWSHLLRILLCGSGTKEASLWTLAKRCSYKYGWIPV